MVDLRHNFSGLGDGWRRVEASGVRLGGVWRRLGAPGAERTRSGGGKIPLLALPINLTTGLKGTRKTRTDIKGYNDVNR